MIKCQEEMDYEAICTHLIAISCTDSNYEKQSKHRDSTGKEKIPLKYSLYITHKVANDANMTHSHLKNACNKAMSMCHFQGTSTFFK